MSEYEKVDPDEPIHVSERVLKPRVIDIPGIEDAPVFQVLPVDSETRLPAIPPGFRAGLTAGSISGQFIGRLPGHDSEDMDGPPLIGLFAITRGGLYLMAIAKSPFCSHDIVLN